MFPFCLFTLSSLVFLPSLALIFPFCFFTYHFILPLYLPCLIYLCCLLLFPCSPFFLITYHFILGVVLLILVALIVLICFITVTAVKSWSRPCFAPSCQGRSCREISFESPQSFTPLYEAPPSAPFIFMSPESKSQAGSTSSKAPAAVSS